MKITSKQWITLTLFALICLWLGVPAFNKWRADKLVDKLCAKDSGIKIYEAVKIPKERFNEWGQFVVADKSYIKPNDEYYSILESKNIQGNSGSDDLLELVVYQYHFWVYRISDHKILGDGISYARRGGDAIGPWMPSSYNCQKTLQSDLLKQIFLKPEN